MMAEQPLFVLGLRVRAGHRLRGQHYVTMRPDVGVG